ncbi:MAG: hypothetical protein ACI33J_08230 [Clostridium sp.]|nr:hypothetical protein [Clostridium sp.]
MQPFAKLLYAWNNAVLSAHKNLTGEEYWEIVLEQNKDITISFQEFKDMFKDLKSLSHDDLILIKVSGLNKLDLLDIEPRKLYMLMYGFEED